MTDRPRKGSLDSPLKRPAKGSDGGWAEKIEIAKKARSEALKARKGKPATFADRVVVSALRK